MYIIRDSKEKIIYVKIYTIGSNKNKKAFLLDLFFNKYFIYLNLRDGGSNKFGLITFRNLFTRDYL